MPKKKKNNVIPQMFDVRPADLADGFLLEKIKKYKKVIALQRQTAKKEKPKKKIFLPPSQIPRLFNTSDIYFEQPSKQPETVIEKIETKATVLQFNRKLEGDSAVPAFIKTEKPKVQKVPTPRKQPVFYPVAKKVYAEMVEPVEEKITVRAEQLPMFSEEKHEKIKKWFEQPEAKQKHKIVRKAKKEKSSAKEELLKNKTRYDFHIGKVNAFDETEELGTKKSAKKKRESLKEKWGIVFENLAGLKPVKSYALAFAVIVLVFYAARFASYGWQIKDRVIVKSKTAISYLAQAQEEISNQEYAVASENIENAEKYFSDASSDMEQLGGNLLEYFSQLPLLSKIGSGKNLVDAGERISKAAAGVNRIAQLMNQMKEPLDSQNQTSMADEMAKANSEFMEISRLLEEINADFEKVNVSDLPSEYQQDFIKVRKSLQMIIGITGDFENTYTIFRDVLGFNGPRRYLFLFQNNNEIRATGGFIGSYGVLNVDNGQMENLFIDGIFNPDGQLWKKVVPPQPIQKISAAWSMHDSNWFPHFPTSAEKAAIFYEKTGGPTTDGVIALTPQLMVELLEITGPIEMPEYEVTIDKDNFVEKTQYEVEVDYDKELNQPKKFLTDLAPEVLNRVFALRDPQDLSKVLTIFSQLLKEKHILIYSTNYEIQKIISKQGWSGEILQTAKDYLMVVNSNINGYKTDGAIDEQIQHETRINSDGTIVDKVRIKRTHNGGDSQYEWLNKVNSDYMRVYVPKGSQLLSVKGQTREFNSPPLDYDKLGFSRDPQVEQEEQSIVIDEESGTRIYEEENKTVFANWVYVSPKETVEIEYEYLLPFRVDLNKNQDRVDSYSLLVQKQSGSNGSDFESKVVLPDNMGLVWKYPESSEISGQKINFKSNLAEDKFAGFVLQGK